jgi:hypothetical protein
MLNLPKSPLTEEQIPPPCVDPALNDATDAATAGYPRPDPAAGPAIFAGIVALSQDIAAQAKSFGKRLDMAE